MERYFVDIVDNTFVFTDEQIHQIQKVMRHKINDEITLINNDNYYLCRIKSILPLNVDIISKQKVDTELKRDITLLYCLPKGDKLDFAIQKATELGVKRIVLVSSSRTIMKIKKEDEKRKFERFNKIALEASEQCSRTYIPKIEGVIPFSRINEYLSSLNLIAYENEKGDIITKELLENHNSVSIIVGSEGGFSTSEVELANSYGFKSISLGKRILRSETAVCYSLTLLSYFSED